MRNITLFCLLIITFVLHSKMWINPNSEIVFGPNDFSVYGGIKVDLSKQNSTIMSKAAGVYFNSDTRLLFIGSAEDSIENISSIPNVTVHKTGGSVWLEDNLNISGNIDFLNGSIETGNDTLNLSLPTSTISGENSKGMVIGNLKSKRYIGTDNSAATNHFGGIGFVINNSGNDIGTVTVHRKTGDGSQTLIQDVESIKRQWMIETSVPFTGTRSVSANWFGTEDNGNRLSLLKAWKFIEAKSGTWEYIPGANFTTIVDPRTASFTIDRATSFTVNMGSYFAGGKGTIDEPWLIRTAQNLDSLRYFVGDAFDDCYFRQIADIDLGLVPWNSGEGWEPIGDGTYPFKAAYDGNGFSINNLTINRPAYENVGLFGAASDSYLGNIRLNNAAVEGRYYVGILAGSLLQYNSVSNCRASGSVSGEASAGGLAGRVLLNSSLYNCGSEGTVESGFYAGGLAGNTDNSFVSCSYSKSDVTGVNDAGGLIGYDYKTYIYDSYAFGDVSATNNVGGFIGNTYQTTISNSYSIGAVAGTSSKGGFVGRNYSAAVTNSYWDKQTSGRDSSACGEGRTTDEMTFEQASNSYVWWDFTSPMSTWEINYGINGGYPYFRWQNIPNTNFAGGKGTLAEPYLIATATQLDKVRYYRTKAFRQTADINLGVAPWSTGSGWVPMCTDWLKPFRGSYDGDFYTISNLTVSSDSLVYASLFGVARNAQIKEIKITNADVTGFYNTGILAGQCDSTSIQDCTVTGEITGTGTVGGLVGYFDGYSATTASFIRCSSNATVTCTGYYAGGLIGSNNNNINVAECYSTGSVHGKRYAGGLIGFDYNSTYSNCYSTAAANADTLCAGGLISYTYYSKVNNSYSKGTVSAPAEAGGLIGYSNYSTFSNSYWNTETSNQGTSAGGFGRNTDDMTFEYNGMTTYMGWDFIMMPVWEINYGINGGYPYLHWQNLPNNNFAGGSGTLLDPYLVSNATQLNLVRYYRTKAFRQTADINLGVAPWNQNEGWDPISTDWMKPFRGSYDGDYHSISNLTIERDSMVYNYVGLFGIARSAEIKEIKISNADVAGYFSAGILIGSCDSTSVQNCSVSGAISGAGNVGGLGGYISYSNVMQCFSEADVTAGWSNAGGLIGYNSATSISNCFASGSVEGDSFIGGLVGSDNSSQILYCYSTGVVSGTGGNIGGLIGYGNGYVYSCYWNTQTSGQSISAGGEGRTTDDMTFYHNEMNTYIGWDFIMMPVWEINYGINGGYPYLHWQNLTNNNFAGGSGTVEDPFLVANAVQLNNVRNYRTKAFRQTADIDLGAAPWNVGAGWVPICTEWAYPFKGSYDGDFYKIRNLTINTVTVAGLFGIVESAELKEIKVDTADVTGHYTAGILAGSCDSTSIQYCSVSGEITGTGSIGGIAGSINYTIISKSFSNAAVITAAGSYIGGIAGCSTGSSNITDCYSTGTVSGDSYIGGLLGSNYQSNVINSYSTGAVSGTNSNIGGLIGYDFSGYIYCSYWNTQTSGQSFSAGGEGKTTDDMTYPFEVYTYSGWDFSTLPTWSYHTSLNGGYPYLSWENRIPVAAPTNLTISIAAGILTLNWTAVTGASGYRVYSSVTPYGTFSLDNSGTFNGTQWSTSYSGTKKFYYVTSVNSTKDRIISIKGSDSGR